MKADLRVKIRNFIKKYKFIVMIVLIGWLILIAINIFLENQEPSDEPQTSYEPFEPIIETGEETPKDVAKSIEETISKYIEYCNNKEYEKAYAMISKDCKEYVYPDISYFENYVNYVFKTDKVYSIQNYSNYNGVYIYRIRIFDDILATGLTGQESFRYFEEKLAFTKENDNLWISLKGFIKKENIDAFYEDKYVKIESKNRIIRYDDLIYNTTIENKTNNYMLIYSQNLNSKIQIKTARSTQNMSIDNMIEDSIVIAPGKKINMNISFDLFYDEGTENEEINFENIAILKENKDIEQLEKEDILHVFSALMRVK